MSERERDAEEAHEQARLRTRAAVERMRAQERALPLSERDKAPNPKFADPIGVHREGRPLPGYKAPPR